MLSYARSTWQNSTCLCRSTENSNHIFRWGLSTNSKPISLVFLHSFCCLQADKDNKQANLVLEVIRDDRLRQLERKRYMEVRWNLLFQSSPCSRRRYAEHVVVTAAKIVGNNSDGDFVSGYEWCIEQVRNSSYLELASGLEIQKAIAYLRGDNFSKVSSEEISKLAETKFFL